MLFFIIALFLVGLFFFSRGMLMVPHQQAWIVQRFGKYYRCLEPGLNWVVPFVDVVAYRHSLKEESIEVPEQTAVTQDNVSVLLDGIVYVKIVDPVAASYGVKAPISSVTQLVQTTMRSEIGKIPLDKTFEEREALNGKIVNAINEATRPWGIRCLRYEIKDIKMPDEIRKAMELQMTAERQKRADILASEGVRQAEINKSEGDRQADINRAEGKRQRILLESEAMLVEAINRAKGQAETIRSLAEASSRGIELLSIALASEDGEKAAALQLAEKYVEAFRQLAKETNTLLLPAACNQPAAMITESLSIYDALQRTLHPKRLTEKESGSQSPLTNTHI